MFILYNKVNISVGHLKCNTVPTIERHLNQLLLAHRVHALPKHPEPTALTTEDDGFDVINVAGGAGNLFFELDPVLLFVQLGRAVLTVYVLFGAAVLVTCSLLFLFYYVLVPLQSMLYLMAWFSVGDDQPLLVL